MSATDHVSARFSAPTPEATVALAQTLAKACRPGDCLLLQGDLGAGKTAFARAFIQSFFPGAEVTSPTFTLLQTYGEGDTAIAHFDLYRLKSAAELVEIGLDEALTQGITLVEWPEIAEGHFPDTALSIRLSMAGQGRDITFSGAASRWQHHLPS